VSDILPLDATDALSAFLDGILAPAGK
jgi:hypothetical protein